MAYGDAVYARTNVDWPHDARCAALPNNDARWLNHLYWLVAVKERSSVLPSQYSPEYFSKMTGLTQDCVIRLTNLMAARWLLAWNENGQLVVLGAEKHHPKLQWKVHEPKDLYNPYADSEPTVSWGLPPDTQPISSKKQPIREGYGRDTGEQNRIEENRIEEGEKRIEEKAAPAAGCSQTATQIKTDLQRKWNEMADTFGLPTFRTWTDKRSSSLKERASEAAWHGEWETALNEIGQYAFLCGHNDRGWRANIDWFLRPDTVTKILEGKYADARALDMQDDSEDRFEGDAG